jgi:hypothetical protein
MSEVVRGFTRTLTGRIVLRVDIVEKGLLATLLEQLIEFVSPESADSDADPLAAIVGIAEDAQRPEDPALARLFPDAYPDDPEASADFRRYTERGLREAKAAAATTALNTLEESGEKITLTVDQAQAWLGALADIRLALGSRLEITEDNHEELANLPDEDPRSGMFHLYDWLTYLTETLVRCLMPR